MYKSDISIVIPVYKNKATLAQLADRISLSLSKLNKTFQIIFVVDASPDDSWEEVQHLASVHKHISGILLATNQGQHNALLIGLKNSNSAFVGIMDADLQDPPELLSELINKCEFHSLTIFARRKGMYQSILRMLTSRIFKTLLGLLIHIPPNVGTYLVMPASVVKSICQLEIKHPQLIVMSRMFSPGWIGVDYERDIRHEGSSAYSSYSRLVAAIRALLCVTECYMLKINNRSLFKKKRFSESVIASRINI